MTRTIKILGGIMAMAMTTLFAACSSTDVVEPQKGLEPKGETITLNLSCPDAEAGTRAGNLHNGHVLRYVAVLYTGGQLKTGEVFDRQEAIVTAGDSKRFTFEVPKDTYSCIVFADYIPADSQTNSEGEYPDKYYNTKDLKERIYMRSFIDFSTFSEGNTNVEEKCFNNENYDCFAYFEENIVKEEEEKIVDITLERIVSRVAFKSSTPMPENVSIKNITFSKFDFFGTHTIKDKSINNSHHAGSSGLNLPVFELPNPYNAQSEELFYFYTFASPKEGRDVSLLEFNFVVNYSDGSSYSIQIPQTKIKPTPNYRITVVGPFLSALKPTVGNLILDIPGIDVESWGRTSEIEL